MYPPRITWITPFRTRLACSNQGCRLASLRIEVSSRSRSRHAPFLHLLASRRKLFSIIFLRVAATVDSCCLSVFIGVIFRFSLDTPSLRLREIVAVHKKTGTLLGLCCCSQAHPKLLAFFLLVIPRPLFLFNRHVAAGVITARIRAACTATAGFCAPRVATARAAPAEFFAPAVATPEFSTGRAAPAGTIAARIVAARIVSPGARSHSLRSVTCIAFTRTAF